MRLEVVDRGGPAFPALKQYVGFRLTSVLDYIVRDIEVALVLLSVQPATESEGGTWVHRCRIVARFADGGQITVEHTDSDTYGSIDGAAESLGDLARWTAAGEGQAPAPGATTGEPLQAMLPAPIPEGLPVDVRTRGVVDARRSVVMPAGG